MSKYEVTGTVNKLEASKVYVGGEYVIIGTVATLYVKVPYIGKKYNSEETEQKFESVSHTFFINPTEQPPVIGDEYTITLTKEELDE